uniref:4-amino-4-deoxy-L-arabinose-phosphoundecaprenol flippase subunit ArnF n=1 Tax=Candidatus Aschnera chinzeii TaxID=1485666 RepID=A0AAT9G528_9ENTR|nr:MAG: 4-amino-4-deoxy-L-arabinose-phosphoundecaprenol flippase subunit ArnF [Candidatus Aschnera chinzeii]
MKGYFYGFITIVFITIAQLFLKLGINTLKNTHFMAYGFNFTHLLHQKYFFLLLCIGIILYLISMIFWLLTLNFFPLSKAYMLISLSYVLIYVLVINIPFFHETTSTIKNIGIIFILYGIWLSCISKINR